MIVEKIASLEQDLARLAGERDALKIEYNAMMVRYETQSAEQTKQIHEDATQIEKFKRHLEECHTRATAAELRGRALSEAINKARRETASDPNNRWCRNATIILNVALTPEGSGAS